MKSHFLCSIFVANLSILLGWASFCQADLISASSTATSHQHPQRASNNTINGSNLNFTGVPGEENDPSKYTHTGGNDNFGQGNVNWLGDGGATEDGLWMTVDLGAVFTLDTVNVFNFGVSTGSNNGRGVQQADLYYRTDSIGNNAHQNNTPFDNTGWTLFGAAGAQTFTIGPTDGLAQGPDTIPLNGIEARFFAFDVNTNHGVTADFSGLGEVQFFGAVIPEPSSLSLLLLGLAGLFARRR